MKAHFWLIVAATMVFWEWEYVAGLWFFSAWVEHLSVEQKTTAIVTFIQDFALYATFVIAVFAHGLFHISATRSPSPAE